MTLYTDDDVRAAVARAISEIRGRVKGYRDACNDDLNRRWNDTDHGGRLACEYVLQEIHKIEAAS